MYAFDKHHNVWLYHSLHHSVAVADSECFWEYHKKYERICFSFGQSVHVGNWQRVLHSIREPNWHALWNLVRHSIVNALDKHHIVWVYHPLHHGVAVADSECVRKRHTEHEWVRFSIGHCVSDREYQRFRHGFVYGINVACSESIVVGAFDEYARFWHSRHFSEFCGNCEPYRLADGARFPLSFGIGILERVAIGDCESLSGRLWLSSRLLERQRLHEQKWQLLFHRLCVMRVHTVP